MNAVFEKTMRRYFGTMFGYVLAAVLLFLLGLCTVLYHVNPAGGSADLSMTLQTLLLALTVLVPIACAYTVTLENKRGETQFLFSLPLSVADIVLGRFFAVMALLCLPLSVLLLLPFAFSLYGTPAIGTALLSIVGLVLLLAVMVALCMTVASLTSSVALSVFGGFFVLLLLYAVSPAAALLPQALSEPILQFLSSFDPFSCLDTFTYGRIDVAGVINTLLWTLLFLFFGALALQRQKEAAR